MNPLAKMSGKNGSRADFYEDIYFGLERVDPLQAVVIRSKHFGGKTFEEIAEAQGISSNTAKTRYYRGLIKLRAFMDPRRQEGK